MISSHRFVLALLVAAVFVAGSADAQTTAPAAGKPAAPAAPTAQPAPPPLPAAGTTAIKATVQALDAAARKVTVKTEQGASVTLGVPEGIAQFA